MLDKLKAILESEEGRKSTEEFFNKIKKENAFKERWAIKIAEYLKTVDNLNVLFEAYDKHDEKQRDILWKRHIDGQSSISLHILRAIEQIGTPADISEYGDFTTEMYRYKGYIFDMICGQGCFVRIWKEK